MADRPVEGNGTSPEHPLRVTLGDFDGPLDLLLHLVRKQELDINQLRLADLTEPYLAHVERMQELNLDVGGEFLVIAATLVWIKSKSLLPRPPADDPPDAETLEEMLLLRLQDYQRFRDAAYLLAQRDQLGRDVFARRPPPEPGPASGEEAPAFEEVSLYSLIEAFRTVLERSERHAALHLLPEAGRVEDQIRRIVERLQERRTLFFHELFPEDATRGEVILAFISVLELVRLGAVRLSQASPLGGIHCRVTETFAQEAERWQAALLEQISDGPGGPAPPQDSA